MTKKNFEIIVYSILGIGAFLVEFLPVSIACIALLSYQGVGIFFEIFEASPESTKGYYLKKGIFLLIIFIMLCSMLFIFMYRHKLLYFSK